MTCSRRAAVRSSRIRAGLFQAAGLPARQHGRTGRRYAPLNGGSTLLFGADMIAEVHVRKDWRPSSITSYSTSTAIEGHRLRRDLVLPVGGRSGDLRVSQAGIRMRTTTSSSSTCPNRSGRRSRRTAGGRSARSMRRLDPRQSGIFSALFQGDDRLPGFPRGWAITSATLSLPTPGRQIRPASPGDMSVVERGR